MGQVKWTTTNHTKGQSPSKKDDAVYAVGLRVLYYELLLENQTINSNKYHSWLDQLKAALDKKCVKLVNRKCIILHQDNTRPHVSLMSRQKLLQLGWEVLNHPRIQWSLYLQISIYFDLYKILLMEKISISWKIVKGTWSNSLLKMSKFWKYEWAWKMAGCSGVKWWIHCSIKFLVKMKNVFYFYLKTEGLFWLTQ